MNGRVGFEVSRDEAILGSSTFFLDTENGLIEQKNIK